MKNRILISIILAAIFQISFAQQASYFDPAQAYNRILIEKNNGTYIRVGRFDVVGSPYLYGEKHAGDLFAKGETAYNIHISYNAHHQQIEFYSSSNPETPLVKEFEEVDSFVIRANKDLSIYNDLKFINGKVLGQEDKNFFQVVYSGPKFILYKKYEAKLEVESTNYIDTDRRIFDIQYSFYYMNVETKEFSKIKSSQNGVKKEFGFHEKTKEILSDNTYSANPEAKLKQLFESLNQ